MVNQFGIIGSVGEGALDAAHYTKHFNLVGILQRTVDFQCTIQLLGCSIVGGNGNLAFVVGRTVHVDDGLLADVQLALFAHIVDVVQVDYHALLVAGSFIARAVSIVQIRHGIDDTCVFNCFFNRHSAEILAAEVDNAGFFQISIVVVVDVALERVGTYAVVCAHVHFTVIVDGATQDVCAITIIGVPHNHSCRCVSAAALVFDHNWVVDGQRRIAIFCPFISFQEPSQVSREDQFSISINGHIFIEEQAIGLPLRPVYIKCHFSCSTGRSFSFKNYTLVECDVTQRFDGEVLLFGLVSFNPRLQEGLRVYNDAYFLFQVSLGQRNRIARHFARVQGLHGELLLHAQTIGKHDVNHRLNQCSRQGGQGHNFRVRAFCPIHFHIIIAFAFQINKQRRAVFCISIDDIEVLSCSRTNLCGIQTHFGIKTVFTAFIVENNLCDILLCFGAIHDVERNDAGQVFCLKTFSHCAALLNLGRTVCKGLSIQVGSQVLVVHILREGSRRHSGKVASLSKFLVEGKIYDVIAGEHRGVIGREDTCTHIRSTIGQILGVIHVQGISVLQRPGVICPIQSVIGCSLHLRLGLAFIIHLQLQRIRCITAKQITVSNN